MMRFASWVSVMFSEITFVVFRLVVPCIEFTNPFLKAIDGAAPAIAVLIPFCFTTTRFIFVLRITAKEKVAGQNYTNQDVFQQNNNVGQVGSPKTGGNNGSRLNHHTRYHQRSYPSR